MSNNLESLKKFTTIVADTGDFESIQQYQPQDATTNPSLILKAAQQEEYQHIVDQAIANAPEKSVDSVIDQLLVLFGQEILKIVPGRVSTEVDARLSFDTQGTIAKAKEIIGLYEASGISKERILIKIASTWEGIRAAEILQGEGIDCNLTLLFSMAQAVACADAKSFLISPFVGRITDWYKKAEGRDSYTPDEDPGVKSVRKIYDYYKSNDIQTVVMGASFRNSDQIKALAGCDNLTIAPSLLDEMENDPSELKRVLSPENATGMAPITMDEATFRWEMNADAMATEKLAEGIRQFTADGIKLDSLIQQARQQA